MAPLFRVAISDHGPVGNVAIRSSDKGSPMAGEVITSRCAAYTTKRVTSDLNCQNDSGV